MTRRNLLFLAGGFLSGAMTVALILLPVSRRASATPQGPGAAAAKEQRTNIDVRPDRRYDLYCTPLTRDLAGSVSGAPTTVSVHGVETTVYRNCLILGITGRGELSERGGRDSFAFSSGSKYSQADFFDNWLVLKQPDGRLTYIPPNAVRFFEESPGQGAAKSSQAVADR
jgi:hypothetical protein